MSVHALNSLNIGQLVTERATRMRPAKGQIFRLHYYKAAAFMS